MQLPPAYFIREALLGYLALVTADDRELLDLFAGNPPAAIATIRRFFATWRPTEIGPTYAREERELPALSVIGMESTTIDHPVGGSLGSYYDADRMTVVDEVGSRDRGGVAIRIFTGSAEHAEILLAFVHATLRHFMFAMDDLELNEMEVSASGLEPDEETLAWPCYRTTVTVTFTYWATVNLRYANAPTTLLVGEPLPPLADPPAHFRYP